MALMRSSKWLHQQFNNYYLSLYKLNKSPHHRPLAADLWCCVFTSCRSAPSRQQYEFLKNGLSIYWAVVVMLHCDWHSCFRAIRPVMWLAESVFINHPTPWSTFHLTQTFYTLCCSTFMIPNSRCAWRCQHSQCAQDLLLCTCRKNGALKVEWSAIARSYISYLLKAQLPSKPFKLQSGFSSSLLKVRMSILQRSLPLFFSGSEWPSPAAMAIPWRSKHLASRRGTSNPVHLLNDKYPCNKTNTNMPFRLQTKNGCVS